MNEKGFTMIEMMIVLLVVSILMIITIPNITKNQGMIRNKGCNAYINLVQAQVEAYKMDNGTSSNPSMDDLLTEKYIKSKTCPNGDLLEVSASGEVVLVP
ncbi:competence type IV pilus major pilin ComGC [Bacillus suaedaesalsae]|uniref:ComG operon protein 3 n=1 Tax=Bacillus suaedaesalsae TaxID=2810349 RepID=A0ABS2DFP1_9BACI|nr:competence type IV pilus major pilin ComGC [Bacillus suaedaesalsae]MBM6617301.1 prepilin-type N-terminal cleavage/methylation domain-containing protein [Bacillus suaedaesalsae]